MNQQKRTARHATIWILALLLCSVGPSFACGSQAGHLFPLAQAQAPQANTYYVAPGGSDDNLGTRLYPWRTIQKAANTLVAGDRVYIRAGTYREQVVPRNSGTAGSTITYAAYPGETAILDGSGITLPDKVAGLFHISNKRHVVVSGLHVINAGPHDNNAGIIVVNSSYITVEHNITYNTNSSGIGVWNSDHVIVDGNRVDEAGVGGHQECISIARTDTFEVRNNEVLNCHKEGIDAKDGASNGQIYGNHVHHTQRVGIYVDAYRHHTYNIAVYQNIVHDIQDDDGIALASEQGGLLENVWVYNNIAYHNRYVGLALYACCKGSATHPVRDVTIVNNTFYRNGWPDWGGGIRVDNPDLENVVIRNNIVSQNLYFQISVTPGILAQNVVIDHNLIDGYRGTAKEIYGDDYVVGDPLFVNPDEADFHLQEGSPAIDQGAALDAPAADHDGRARPQDGNRDGRAEYDIGAYEAVAYTGHPYLCCPSWETPRICPRAGGSQRWRILP